MKQDRKPKPPWRVLFTEETQARATADIARLCPRDKGQDAERAWRDIWGWYRRWVEDLARDPLKVLGAPPLGTDDPAVARFPADESLPISGIADVDLAQRTITVLAVHVRGPKGRQP